MLNIKNKRFKNFFFLITMKFLSAAYCSNVEHKKDTFVVVDGFSGGIYIAPLLRGYGYKVIHITSILGKNLGYSFIENDYIACLYEEENLKTLIASLEEWGIKNIRGVFAGSEAGVFLAEKLNSILNLPYKNDPRLIHTRRNKYYMQEVLKKAGISSIKQIITNNFKEIEYWIKCNPFPIVLKPIESAGSDNVFICNTKQEAREAFDKIISSLNIFKIPNRHVLCQEYIDGQEYMINSVSYEGHHSFVEILKIYKIGNRTPLYNYFECIYPFDPHYEKIVNYLKEVYNALGIKFGATHAEVKVRKNNLGYKINLIEVGARLGGIAAPSAFIQAHGYSQVTCLVDSFVKPDFIKNFKIKRHPKQKVVAVYLISKTQGYLKENFHPSLFRNLKTFHLAHFNFKKGEYFPKTTHLLNNPGYIYLVGEEREILQDIQMIRALENSIYLSLLR